MGESDRCCVDCQRLKRLKMKINPKWITDPNIRAKTGRLWDGKIGVALEQAMTYFIAVTPKAHAAAEKTPDFTEFDAMGHRIPASEWEHSPKQENVFAGIRLVRDL